jgi:hypothetical protein
MLQKDKKHSDSIALTESLLIAVWRLLGDGLALSVIASQCHLSQRERHWRVGQAHAGRAKFGFIINSSALLQRAAASRQEHFVKLL